MNNMILVSTVSPVKKLRLALLAMLLLVLAGTLCFTLVEHLDLNDSLYMTITTLSTVGYGDFVPHTPMGKMVSMGIIVIGFFVGGAMIAFLGQIIVEGQFTELVARRKMENKLRKISDHFIVAGYGRVGRQVAKEFARRKVPFIVIESDQEGIERLLHDGHLFVHGDATNEEVLTSAAIERATTLISTLPKEALNVYLTLTARHMNGGLKIIVRADFEDGEIKLRRAGADHVIIPPLLGGIRMAKAALQPNVVDFMEIAAGSEDGLGVEEIIIPDNSKLRSKSLSDSGLKQEYGVTIIGIRKPGESLQLNPGSQTMLGEGDVLVLMGHIDQLEKLSNDLNNNYLPDLHLKYQSRKSLAQTEASAYVHRLELKKLRCRPKRSAFNYN